MLFRSIEFLQGFLPSSLILYILLCLNSSFSFPVKSLPCRLVVTQLISNHNTPTLPPPLIATPTKTDPYRYCYKGLNSVLKTDDNDNDCHVIRGQQKCPLYMCEVGLDVSFGCHWLPLSVHFGSLL